MADNSNVKKSTLDKILDAVERAGNKLPDPITMFLGLAVVVAIVSAICSAAGVSAVNPSNGETITVFNLLSIAGIQYLWTNVITNFSGFAPLGMVLVAVIGSSVAEKSGFLVAFMEKFLGKSKGWIVTMVVMFLGINLNVAGDAGFIVLPPLAAILFMSIGRHPMLGLYAGFASVAAGFCANGPREAWSGASSASRPSATSRRPGAVLRRDAPAAGPGESRTRSAPPAPCRGS